MVLKRETETESGSRADLVLRGVEEQDQSQSQDIGRIREVSLHEVQSPACESLTG